MVLSVEYPKSDAVVVSSIEQQLAVSVDLPKLDVSVQVPINSVGNADVLRLLGSCKMPDTLEEIGTFYSRAPAAVAEAVRSALQSVRHLAYEEDLATQLQRMCREDSVLSQRLRNYGNSANSCAALNIPVHRPAQVKESIKTYRRRIVHYCHLVFWALCRMHLCKEAYARLMGDFNESHDTGVCSNSRVRSTHSVAWYSIDETVFGLPVDLDNIPAVVRGFMLHAHAQALVVDVRRLHQKRPCSKKDEYALTMQRKEKLWKFKAFVAEKLCKATRDCVCTGACVV